MRRLPLAALTLALAAIGTVAQGSSSLIGGNGPEQEFLPVDEAFRFDASATGPDKIVLSWQIADGYYLYRSRLKAIIDESSNPERDVQLGQLQLPRGKDKEDEFFGRQEVYYHALEAGLPLARPAGGVRPLALAVTYQGCADAGLCYPPETKRILITLPAASGAATLPPVDGFRSQQDRLADVIRRAGVAKMLAVFFGLGLLLAFTPCVLPMVPILSGIIAGQGTRLTRRRAFALSMAYVLGMAATYTLAGITVAKAGFNLTATFQNPWIVGAFALVFVALALAMFGVYTIQMPAGIQTQLSRWSNNQTSGTYTGVAAMGALSALIVSACVAPPLIAALIVIGQTGDALRGGGALFAMALGMGTPLLVVGAAGGHWLPKAGPWMDTVKRFFGVLMLLVAVWLAARLFPARWQLVLWAIPIAIAAALFWQLSSAVRRAGWIAHAAAIVLTGYAGVMIVGAARGATDPLRPLATTASHTPALPFQRIKTVHDLERAVATAASAGKPVMLDFYADWCVSCIEMERYTFTDPRVRQALAGWTLLQADVTAHDGPDQALLKHFGIFGPPTIAFYGPDGHERRDYRLVGFVKAADFVTHLRAAGLAPSNP
ncbi:MAG: protein-disulfide reductase DsbD [Gammaproteobacteria bacterium]|nr:protein-disulfide reductase DsbD [Gammaproteobacteria bacterium]